MKREIRETAEAIAESVRPLGFTCALETGGKHPQIVVTGAGRWAKFAISGSPRCADAQINKARQQVLAWIDRCGVGSGRGGKGERRRIHKSRRVRSTLHHIEVAIDPETGPARDPWAVLSRYRDTGVWEPGWGPKPIDPMTAPTPPLNGEAA